LNKIVLDGCLVGDEDPTFVIAEVGRNHGGDLAVAEELVRQAADAGADAVKFQTYVTEKRVSRDNPAFDLLKRCELSHDDLVRLMDELVNHSLLRRVARTGLPVIVSRGMADVDEIATALRILDETDSPVALMHCVSAYPTEPVQANLRAIHNLRSLFDRPIGYSDHTVGITAPIAAVAAGACLVEKHFTLDRNREGGDHSLSLEPDQMRDLVDGIRETEQMLGSGRIGCSDAERPALIFRRPS
jgi:sialic acid synthase SpsE